MAATTTTPHASATYVLRDELAQLCLPTSSRDPNRRVAWVNAVCVFFLAVGLMGVEKPMELVLKFQQEEPLIMPIEDVKAPTPPPETPQLEVLTEETEVQAIEAPPPSPVMAVADPGKVAFPVIVENATLMT